MGLLESLYSPTLAGAQQALSLATQRETLLHTNLANANTPGYKRKDIDFNVSLAAAMGDPMAANLKQVEDADRQNLSDQTSIMPDGNNVDMEREVQGIAETQLRYSALSEMTANYFSELKSVITGTK